MESKPNLLNDLRDLNIGLRGVDKLVGLSYFTAMGILGGGFLFLTGGGLISPGLLSGRMEAVGVMVIAGFALISFALGRAVILD